MAVNFRSGPAVTSGSQTTGFTLSTHVGTQAGDLLVLTVTNRDATANPTVTDNDTGGNTWTRLTTINAATNGSVSVWWKYATSGTASKTITVSGCTGSASGVMVTWTGTTDATTPMIGAVGEANASGNETQAQITTTRNGSAVVLCVACTSNDTLNPTSYTATSPSSLTEIGEGVSIGGSDCSNSIAWAAKATAGATGSFNWSQTDGTGASIAFELLVKAGPLTADSGSFSLTGISATLSYNRKVVAESGAFSLTGSSATLSKVTTLAAASGTFGMAGAVATLLYNRSLVAATGGFSLTGSLASLVRQARVSASSGSFGLTGAAADLVYTPGSGYQEPEAAKARLRSRR